jgi:uncharacterized membrane protein
MAGDRSAGSGAEEPGRAGVVPVAPTRSDAVPRALARLVGGPQGDHAAPPRGRGVALRVLIALAVLSCTLGWIQKAPCRDVRTWVHDKQYTSVCYSDVTALYGVEGLIHGQLPYVDHPVEYPVVIGAVMELASAVTDVLAPAPAAGVDVNAQETARYATFFDVTTLLMAIGVVVTVVATGLTAARRRVWDAALVALAPTVVLHLATNWDMIAVALTSVGMLLWARKRPVPAGILLGLGIATKLYPILVLLALLPLCLRAGRLRAFGRTAAAAAVAVLGVYLPSYLVAASFTTAGVRTGGSPLADLGNSGLAALAPHRGAGLNATLRFLQLNTVRPADWDSLYFQLQEAMGRPLDLGSTPARLNALTAILFLAVLCGIGWLTLAAPRRPRVPQVAFLLVVAFLLTSKVWSPQYVLWLVPLYALARPRWGAFLAWQATEAILLVTRFLYFTHRDYATSGVTQGWFFAAVLLRDLVLLALCVLVVREVWFPELDAVRRTPTAEGTGYEDDPAGGVLCGAPDVLVLRGTPGPGAAAGPGRTAPASSEEPAAAGPATPTR